MGMLDPETSTDTAAAEACWDRIRQRSWSLAWAVAFRRLNDQAASTAAAEAAFASLRLQPIDDTPVTLDVRIARAADMAALELLHMQFATRALQVARGILRDAGAAEDVVQEAFIKLATHAPTSQVERPAALVLQIVRHSAIDALRHQHGRHAPSPRSQSIEAMTESGGDLLTDPQAVSVEEQVELNETQQLVHAHMARLGEQHRQLVELYYFANLSLPTIAARLGEPLERIKKRLQTARRHLRCLLTPVMREITD